MKESNMSETERKGKFKRVIRHQHGPQLLNHLSNTTLIDEYSFHISKCKKAFAEHWQVCWTIKRVPLTANLHPGWFVCLHRTPNHRGNHQLWPYNLGSLLPPIKLFFHLHWSTATQLHNLVSRGPNLSALMSGFCGDAEKCKHRLYHAVPGISADAKLKQTCKVI